jgi:hypothetical protein
MKCSDYLLIIDDYFDGELDEKQIQVVETHLFVCVTCSKAYKALEEEQKVYNDYQRNIVVSEALRSSIEAEIEKEINKRPKKSTPWLKNLVRSLFGTPNFVPILATASLILVTVTTTILIMKSFSKIETNSGQVTTSINSTLPENVEKTENIAIDNNSIDNSIDKVVADSLNPSCKFGEKPIIALEPLPAPKMANSKRLARANSPAQKLIKEAEGKYLEAIAILAKDSKKNYKKMSPELKASFDKSLRIIDENIAQTRRAINQNPQDPIVAQYMLAAYAKKVEVLQEIASLK